MTDQRTQLPPIWKKPLDPAIHVRVYKNGDGNFPGKLVTLNKRQQRTFDSWLGELSNSMKLRTGAVWRVFTPTQGHRVDNFERLEDGHMIVVAGQERFKPLRYAQIDPNPKKAPPRTYDVEPGHNRHYQVSGRYRKVDTHARIIKCWANGNETSAPRTVLLPAHRNKPLTLDDVIEQVSGVLCEECCGPVEKLYLPNGIKVMSMDQILPNAHYVALRKYDTFKRAHYKEVSLPNLRTSPRLERKSVLPPLSRSNKTSSHSSPEHSYSSQNGYRRERAKREEDQVFHARPVKHKRSSEKTRQVDYDQDNGGVFKAKSQNNATRGARPIDESRQTRTELPVDKRPAEQVQDEDGDGRSARSLHTDKKAEGDHQDEEVKGRDRKDKKGKKDEGAGPPPPQQEQRPFRANSKQPNSPGNEQARREAEKEARARREAEDRERAEKTRQQREAMQQKKKEKEDQKKREEEEKKRKAEERKELEEEKKRRAEEEKRREEEERRWREEEEERKRAAAAAATSTPDRYENQNFDQRNSPRITPITDDRSGTEVLREEQRKLAEQEEMAAAKIQAGFRAYKTRKELKQKHMEEEISGGRESMASLMRDEPLPLEGDDDWGPGPAGDNQVKEAEEKAAVTLQAGFRGYKARQEVKAMRTNQEVKDKGEETPPARQQTPPSPMTNNPSTTPTQTMANDISQAEAEHAAATKIQATFRGHQTRKELARAQATGQEEVAVAEGTEQNINTQY